MTLPPITAEWLSLMGVMFLATVFAVYLAARDKRVEASVGEEFEQLDLLTAAEAVAQRAAILEEVATRNSGWLALAAAEMAKLETGLTGIGEDWKRLLKQRGVPEAPHPNAVGAFIATMVRRGVLVPTGEYRPMREVRSNGRKSPVYELQRPEAA